MNQNLIDHFMQSSFFELFFSWVLQYSKVNREQLAYCYRSDLRRSDHVDRHQGISPNHQSLTSYQLFKFKLII